MGEPAGKRKALSPPWGWPDVVAALLVFAVALVLRLVYLSEIAAVPFYEYPIMDARAYDAWAMRIASGDWIGEDTFYQAPAYPYLLAVIYRVFGHDLELAHRLMMGLGALSCVLLFLATRVLFSRAAGLAAGMLIAVYPVALFFDGQIGKTGLALFLTSLLLFLLVSYQRAPHAGWALWSGLVMGLLALTRENALVFVLVVPFWMAWRNWVDGERGRRAATDVLCVAMGALLVLGAVSLRNQWLGGSFELTTAQVGPNFYIGNNPDATGLYEPLVAGRHTPDFESPDATRLAEAARGQALSRGEVSDYWLGRGFEFVVEQPGAWFRLMAYKAFLTWNDYEIADTEDMYVYADWSRLLQVLAPYAGFGLLATLGAAGFVLGWERRKDTALLLILMFTFSFAVALFMVFGRMRFPLVPLLVPLAGYALVTVPQAFRDGNQKLVAMAAAVAGVVALLAQLPLLDEDALRANGYANLGVIMLNESRPEEAELYLEKAEAIYSEQSDLQYALGLLRARQRRFDVAEEHLRRMIRLEESDHRGHRLLATVLKEQGRMEEAWKHHVRGQELDPSNAKNTPGLEPPPVTPR